MCLQLPEQQSFYQARKGATCKCIEVTHRITHSRKYLQVSAVSEGKPEETW